ncbi:MAG: transaldolase [Gemmatimonadota bacterium]|nr:transaldolase [Gemmatimonadota bacterium]
MDNHRLQALHDAGQSIWLDYIDRTILHNGDLARRLTDDVLTGMTSNPTIFQKALAEGNAYDAQLRTAPDTLDVHQLFELVETRDVSDACDIFADVYHRTAGADGFVSIEVSPGVADDATATVEEARRLWQTVNRPNLLVKVPGTQEGAKAVRQLISEGINVNITLLFAVAAYERVIDAYIDGLEARVQSNQPVDRTASVASFFVSRVDTEVDKRLEAIGGTARNLEGRAAIANAKTAYQLFVTKFGGSRWKALEARGARVQRPLWASTSTKNPAYRDVMYVESLIGPDTVNTMPPQTIDDFRDHGVVKRTVDANMDQVRSDLAALAAAGIDMADVTTTLLREGLASFEKSFVTLSDGIKTKIAQLRQSAT